LEIWGQLEGQFPPTQKWLGMQILAVLSQRCDGGRAGVERGLRLQTGHMSVTTFEADIPEVAENPWQSERSDSIDREHVVKGSSVVSENHGSALTGSPPQAVPAKRELPVCKIQAHVGVQQLKAADSGDGDRRTSRPSIR